VNFALAIKITAMRDKNLFESMVIGTPSYNTAAADLLVGAKMGVFHKTICLKTETVMTNHRMMMR
jgi:hypothetical protein